MSMRSSALSLGLAGALVLLPGCDGMAAPSTVRADPASIGRVLAAARGGERIVLGLGQYGRVDITKRAFARPITIDASQAVFTQIILRNVDGVAISGGAVEGPRMQTFAVVVDFSKHVSLTGMHVSGSRIGITISRSQDVAIENNSFDGIRSDGVNIAGSQRVRIVNNVCRNNDPIPVAYDAAGKEIPGGDHPDCIQGWSMPGPLRIADITIIGNRADGFMQGVFFQNGSDRMIVRNNTFNLSLWNGITLYGARDADVSNNTVRTIAGARMPIAPFRPVTSWIKVFGDQNRVCGNTVDQPRFSRDSGPCGK